jgi:hypothetical protein
LKASIINIARNIQLNPDVNEAEVTEAVLFALNAETSKLRERLQKSDEHLSRSKGAGWKLALEYLFQKEDADREVKRANKKIHRLNEKLRKAVLAATTHEEDLVSEHHVIK